MLLAGLGLLLLLLGLLLLFGGKRVEKSNVVPAPPAVHGAVLSDQVSDDQIQGDGSVYELEDTMEFMAALLAVPGDGFMGTDEGPATAAAGVFKSAKEKITVSSVDAKAHAYVKRFKNVAIAEYKARKILPSVKLAQGLIESAMGESFLATKANNHFGMKCGSQKKGHTHKNGGRCVRRCDDSCSDHFWVMPSAWASYRAHSDLLLRNKRYSRAIEASKSGDYVKFAKELKRAGYATKPNYAQVVTTIIKRYKLYEIDRQAGAPVCWGCR